MPTQPRSNKTVALLFFQSSTRTRLGFEAATVGLGAHPIGMEDMSSPALTRVGEIAGGLCRSSRGCAMPSSCAIMSQGAAARMASKSCAGYQRRRRLE